MKYLTLCLVILLGIGIGTVKAQSPITIGLEASNLRYIERNNEFNRIGLCESGGDLHAKSRYSSASGEYQFINASWYKYGKELWGDEFYEKNIWSTDNRELAWYVYSKYGNHDWDASRSCWNKS